MLIRRKREFKTKPSQARLVKRAIAPVIIPAGAVIKVGYTQINNKSLSRASNANNAKKTKQMPIRVAITIDIIPKIDFDFWGSVLFTGNPVYWLICKN